MKVKSLPSCFKKQQPMGTNTVLSKAWPRKNNFSEIPNRNCLQKKHLCPHILNAFVEQVYRSLNIELYYTEKDPTPILPKAYRKLKSFFQCFTSFITINN